MPHYKVDEELRRLIYRAVNMIALKVHGLKTGSPPNTSQMWGESDRFALHMIDWEDAQEELRECPVCHKLKKGVLKECCCNDCLLEEMRRLREQKLEQLNKVQSIWGEKA